MKVSVQLEETDRIFGSCRSANHHSTISSSIYILYHYVRSWRLFVYSYIGQRCYWLYKFDQRRFGKTENQSRYLHEAVKIDSFAFRRETVEWNKNMYKSSKTRTSSSILKSILIFSRIIGRFSKLFEFSITLLFAVAIIVISAALLMIQAEIV